MKKSIYIGSISVVIISITGISSGFAASTTTSRVHSLPPEFSTLSTTELTTLSTLTGSAREDYLTSLGATIPSHGSGTQDNSGSLSMKHGSGNLDKGNIPDMISLTEDEKTALASMTEDERNTFFASKGITRPTDNSGSGNTIEKNRTKNKQSRVSNSGSTIQESTIVNQSRVERIAKQKAKILEQKKTKIQKKILANENLTRLEKKFADANNIEY